jgi:ribosomal protein S18 acetylase RimI-like enzyme
MGHGGHMTTVRRAGHADLETLLHLVTEFHAHERIASTLGSRRAAVLRLLAEPRLGRVLLATGPDGEALGYGILCLGFSVEFGGVDAFVDELYVRPAHRGAGLGGRLLDALEAEARGSGVVALHLEVDLDNPRALELYRRRGFAEHARRLMTRRL